MTEPPAHWPPKRSPRKHRRHCGAKGGGHRMETHPATPGGRPINACRDCGERGYDITYSPRKR